MANGYSDGIASILGFYFVFESKQGLNHHLDLLLLGAPVANHASLDLERRVFAHRESGRRHWLLGHVGPLSEMIPAKVASDLGIPVVFANQCGETHTTITILFTRIQDRFAGLSSICDGRHGEPVRAGDEPALLISPITLHPAKGPKTWHFTSPSAPAAFSSA